MFVVKENVGDVINGSNYTIIKKGGKKGDTIAKHNHPEANVIFTVVKGDIVVTLNDDVEIELVPGKVLNFDGNNHISAVMKEDSEIFITLVLK